MSNIRSSFRTNQLNFISTITDDKISALLIEERIPVRVCLTKEFDSMGSQKVVAVVIWFAMLLSRAAAVTSSMDCTTVVGLISACTTFVTYGSPDPMPGSPCCDAVGSLNSVADSTANGRQLVCRCLMGLITTYSPNATAIATLPGFCGVSLGFTIEPNTDCDFIT